MSEDSVWEAGCGEWGARCGCMGEPDPLFFTPYNGIPSKTEPVNFARKLLAELSKICISFVGEYFTVLGR